jgi:hypothetical protein
MADWNEKVTVVDWDPTTESMVDGKPVIRYIVENHRGERFIVEP